MLMTFINYRIYYWRLGHSPKGHYGHFHRIGRNATNARCSASALGCASTARKVSDNNMSKSKSIYLNKKSEHTGHTRH